MLVEGSGVKIDDPQLLTSVLQIEFSLAPFIVTPGARRQDLHCQIRCTKQSPLLDQMNSGTLYKQDIRLKHGVVGQNHIEWCQDHLAEFTWQHMIPQDGVKGAQASLVAVYRRWFFHQHAVDELEARLFGQAAELFISHVALGNLLSCWPFS